MNCLIETTNFSSSNKCVTTIVTDIHRQIIQVINYVILCSLVGLFGMITNVINMVIFYKQGLDTTINISFFSLAVSDLCGLIFQLCFNIFVNPLFENSETPLAASEIVYVIAGVPRETFSRITCLITVYITAERCLCIVFPLHVKRMITPRRAIIIMLLIYGVTILSFAPLCYTTYIEWKFYPDKNISLQGLLFTSDREYVEGIVLIIHAVVGTLSFVAVIVLTMILIKKLQDKNTWRKAASVDSEKTETLSNRDQKTMKMVVLIASVLIICYTPSAAMFFTTFIEPEFAVSGTYSNLFFAVWSFGFLFETINSSVNIFLYLNMSSKFRATFRELFIRDIIDSQTNVVLFRKNSQKCETIKNSDNSMEG